MAMARYDRIGHGYATTRRPDPRLRALIDRELGDARTVVDVGAGTGSYEPAGRHVVAIEPSDVMAAQRPSHLAPALRADAAHLPLRDASVDAALAVLTVHHWGRDAEAGVRELRRVAAGPVLIVTFDTEITQELWMIRDYLPEIAEQDRRDFPALEQLARWLGPGRLRHRAGADLPRDARLDAGVALGAPGAGARSRGDRRDVRVRAPRTGGQSAGDRRARARPRIGGVGSPQRHPALAGRARRRSAPARPSPGRGRPAHDPRRGAARARGPPRRPGGLLRRARRGVGAARAPDGGRALARAGTQRHRRRPRRHRGRARPTSPAAGTSRRAASACTRARCSSGTATTSRS